MLKTNLLQSWGKLNLKNCLFLPLIGFGCSLAVPAAQAATVTFDSGTIINSGSQTFGGIKVNYNLSQSGTAVDTSKFGTPSNKTGQPFPGATTYTLLAAYSDLNDGNAFQDTAKTTPTGATQTPLVVDVKNYVNYNFTFDKPVDLTNFRVSDLDYDHADNDKYHDAISVIAQKPNGTFSVVTGGTVGTDLQTYTAKLIANPTGGPNYTVNGISTLTPYRHKDNAATGTLSNLPSNNTTAVVYDSSLKNISAVNVLYWSERNETATNYNNLQGIALNGQFQATEVPFEFSPTLGLILTGFGIGLRQWWTRSKTQS